MIKVILGEEVRSQNKASKWRWRIEGAGLEGLARDPLLDACRAIMRSDSATARQQIGIYRHGKDKADMFCTVAAGAKLTVREDEKAGPVFVKWIPHPMAMVQLKGSQPDIVPLDRLDATPKPVFLP